MLPSTLEQPNRSRMLPPPHGSVAPARRRLIVCGMLPTYTLKHTSVRPRLASRWGTAPWPQAETLTVGEFRPESSDHRPLTQARLLYDTSGIYGMFRVQDRYVRSVCQEFQGPVCKDSCVEFFVSPDITRGYINFEFNCGGILHCSHCGAAPTSRPLTPAEVCGVRIFHSLPARVEPEIAEPTEWRLAFFLPFTLMTTVFGELGEVTANPWRANFFKCASHTSHPHWASWAPVPRLCFHMPECFGQLRLGGCS